MGEINRICILRLSAIGDCVHTLAVVRALQRALPNVELTWIIGRTEASLMQGLDGVELIVVDKRGGREAKRAFANLMARRQFDVLLNLHASWRANLISRRVQAPRKVGFDRGRARDFQWWFTNERIAAQHRPHVIDGLLGFVTHIGVSRDPLEWRLPLQPADYQFPEPLASNSKPLVVISPCSSQRARNFRNWPAERFAEVTQALVARHDVMVAVTGGDSALEIEYAAEICEAAPGSTVDLTGKTSLKMLAALIDKADCLICPDSGPAHIASAVATPVIGLYATSNPGRTGPVLDSQFTINAYPRALSQFMGKSVDTVRWGQRVRHADAMSLITVDEVLEQADHILG